MADVHLVPKCHLSWEPFPHPPTEGKESPSLPLLYHVSSRHWFTQQHVHLLQIVSSMEAEPCSFSHCALAQRIGPQPKQPTERAKEHYLSFICLLASWTMKRILEILIRLVSKWCSISPEGLKAEMWLMEGTKANADSVCLSQIRVLRHWYPGWNNQKGC